MKHTNDVTTPKNHIHAMVVFITMVKTITIKAYKYKCDLILENDQLVTFGILRNIDSKYSSHCSSLVLDCSHTRYTV